MKKGENKRYSFFMIYQHFRINVCRVHSAELKFSVRETPSLKETLHFTNERIREKKGKG
jgi:hypothetical protein